MTKFMPCWPSGTTFQQVVTTAAAISHPFEQLPSRASARSPFEPGYGKANFVNTGLGVSSVLPSMSCTHSWPPGPTRTRPRQRNWQSNASV